MCFSGDDIMFFFCKGIIINARVIKGDVSHEYGLNSSQWINSKKCKIMSAVINY